MQKQAKTYDKTDIHDTIVKVMKNKEYKFCMLVNKVVKLNLRKECVAKFYKYFLANWVSLQAPKYCLIFPLNRTLS